MIGPGRSCSKPTTCSCGTACVVGAESRTTPPMTVLYATLDGPARAIRCAQELADAVRRLSIEIRAGIHTGQCESLDGKHAGLTVTIGARVAGLAEPSQVLVSQTVKDLVAGSGLSFG